MGELIAIERRDDGVAVVTMADEAGHNAMTPAFVRALVRALDEVEAWPRLKVVVLAGTEDVFSSGADLTMLSALVDGSIAPAEIVLPKRVLDVPVPVVAAMTGHAIGGGLALGLCADVVFAARQSRYGCSFMNMGFTPGMGMTKLLEHVAPPAIAHEMLLTGEPKRGRWLEARGVFNAVLDRPDVLPHALDVAARIADKPRPSLEILRRTLTLPRRQAFELTHTIESLMHRVSFGLSEVRERIGEELHAP
ncbi:MAG: enoyl-CoA hydratase/isomerase family protein [Sandaracinaceae bacterium]|nr:enoyl-CoA hydratase/isomerase family protein [Sandaracinaceae bacterium]